MNRSRDRRERAALRARIAELEVAVEAVTPDEELATRTARAEELIHALSMEIAAARGKEASLNGRIEALEIRVDETAEPEPAPVDPKVYDAKLISFTPTVQMSSGASITTVNGRRQFMLPASSPRMPSPPNGPGGFRCEWHHQDHAEEGVTRAAAFELLIPADYDLGTNSGFNDRIIFQVHENDGSPVFSLHIDEQDRSVWFRHKKADGSFEYGVELAFTPGTPLPIAFAVRYSRDGTGFFEGWSGRTRIARWDGATLNPNGRAPYMKHGIYGQPTKVLFGDMRIAEGPDALAFLTNGNS